jgi:hypothetical protein
VTKAVDLTDDERRLLVNLVTVEIEGASSRYRRGSRH